MKCRMTTLGLFFCCATSFAQSQLPEIPAIDRSSEVQAMDLNGDFTAPFIPSHRTTADGRVAVPVIFGSDFLLNVPEKISGQYLHSANGTGILAQESVNGPPQRLSFNRFELVDRTIAPNATFGMRAICDATSQFPEGNNSPTSPLSCGTPEAPADCYRFTLMTSYLEPQGSSLLVEMWGRKVEVVVTDPKTPEARLSSYRWLEPAEQGVTLTLPNGANKAGSAMAEPVFTNDGKLFVARMGDTNITWNNGSGNVSGQYNIMYSVAPNAATPCALSSFGQLKPITHAPYDDEMIGRYGIADYPFRDSEGNLISDGQDLNATYPWIDRRGHNLLVETVSSKLHNVVGGVPSTRYPTRCVENGCNLNPTAAQINQNGTVEWKGSKQGISIVGRWTRGKLVLLDGMVNSTDFALDYRPDRQREILLYEAGTGPNGSGSAWVNAGVSQHNNPEASLRERHGMDGNFNIIDSMENLWQYKDAFRPVSFRDISWLVTSGHTTAAVSFDDYIDSSAFIVSDMTASQSHLTNTMKLRDGFNPGTGTFTQARRVQNAATTLDFQVPSYGAIQGGARIEPIAMGGIDGRGLFLEPGDSVQYDLPADVNRPEWAISVFIDPRPIANNTERLITFPDGTNVDIVGRNQIRVRKNGTTFSTAIPGGQLEQGAWSHIGFVVQQEGAEVAVYFNGFRANTWSAGASATRMFRMAGSTLSLGGQGASAGVRGWLDEFKVFAHGGSAEYMCNLARGTLIGLPQNADPVWMAISNGYPDQNHSFVGDQLPGNLYFSRYACFRDYTGNNLAYRGNLPNGSVSVGPAINFPEGPLVAGQPRPDSTNNSFCLTCHTNSNTGGLDLAALQSSPALLEYDARRQPMQAPRLLFGVIPRNLILGQAPDNDMAPPPAPGLRTDLYIHSHGGTSPPPPTGGTGKIGNYVWHDSNGDGTQDSSEIGLDGAIVNLQDCNSNNAVVDTVHSDSDGAYLFTNVGVGDFNVEFVEPAGYRYTTANVGASATDSNANESSGLTGCLSMAAGQSRLGIDAGFVETVPPATGVIGNFVWIDADMDGIQDGTESGADNVTIFLQNCDDGNRTVRATVSDPAGDFLFESVPEGMYRLSAVLPSGYTFSPAGSGGDYQLDSNVDPDGYSPCYDMAAQKNRRAIDVGLQPL